MPSLEESLEDHWILEWRKDGSKYNYDIYEKLAMAIFTALTNFSCFPGLIMLYRRRMMYQTFIGFFTFLTSFMYHLLESIGCSKFILSEFEWHKLGSRICIINK